MEKKIEKIVVMKCKPAEYEGRTSFKLVMSNDSIAYSQYPVLIGSSPDLVPSKNGKYLRAEPDMSEIEISSHIALKFGKKFQVQAGVDV